MTVYGWATWLLAACALGFGNILDTMRIYNKQGRSVHFICDYNLLPSLPERGARVMHFGLSACLFVFMFARLTKKNIASIDLIVLHKKYYSRCSVLL